MALKVWLPLNKDTRNVGLNNVKATNNGATLTNGGVYNNCYHFGTASSYMTLPPSCMTGFTTACTVSFWLRIKTWNTSYATFFQAGNGSSPWNNYIFGFLRNSSNSTVCFTISNSSSSSQNNYLTSALSLNTWYHVVLIYETGKCKIYLNGTLDHQYTTTFVPHFAGITKITLGTCNATSSYQTDCDMNDLRIYDNALTEEDVERIYQQKLFELIPYSGVKDVLFDRSGFMNMPLVNKGASFQNNALYFNGSAKLRPKEGNVGFTMDDGTLSVWFTIETASTNYQLIYIDSVSKFAIGIIKSSNTIITTCNGTGSKTKFTGTSIKYDGSVNNIIVSYNTGKTPQFMLINGVSVGTNGTYVWTESSGLTIGNRMYNSAQSGFKGKLLKVGVYNRQFTQDEAVELYNSEYGMFLPDDYIYLDYIESSGAQYIDTGVKANQNTRIEIEFEITGNETGYGAIFGARTNSSSNCFDAFTKCGNGKIGVQIGNSGSKNCNTSQSLNVVYNLKASNGNITVNGDSANFTPVSDFETPLNVRIFDIANGSTSSSGTGNRILIGKVYKFKMYDGQIIVRNMLPSKQKSNNVIGMYDMVSRQFFTNAGSGSFTGA